MFQVFGKGMPIKYENKSLTSGENPVDFGNLIIDLVINFPETLGEKQIEYLKKILIYPDRKIKQENIVQAYYYKNKEDVVKEMMNDKDEEDGGCIQQ